MPDGIEVVAGDARDHAFARKVCEGASVIYHCMNPSAYTSSAWEEEFPALGESLIAAALAADARLVCLDNLYGYGIAETRTEETALAATGRKGRVRILWDQRLRSAVGLRFAVGRAGDFFGPGTNAQSLFSADAVAGMMRGSRPWLIGDVDATHAFSYVPDVVAGLVALGTADADVEGQFFHLPVVSVSPRELVRRLSAAAGHPLEPRVLPSVGVRLLGLFIPLMRELQETFYQWDRPFLVDDSRFRRRFPSVATSLDGAVAGSIASAA